MTHPRNDLPPAAADALRVFEAAARHLSFKEAANELSITQAASAIRSRASRTISASSCSAAGTAACSSRKRRAPACRNCARASSRCRSGETIRERAQETSC